MFINYYHTWYLLILTPQHNDILHTEKNMNIEKLYQVSEI